MNWSYGMDGYKYNEVISAGWLCLLLWQIYILGGAFEQEGSGGGGRGGRAGHFNTRAETILSLKGTNLTVIERIHPFISPAWYRVLF